MELASTVSVGLLVAILGVFLGSLVFDRSWWTRIRRGLSDMLDPLRAINWTLPPVVGLVALVVLGQIARTTQSIPVIVLWVVSAVLEVAWFCRGRYQTYRYKQAMGSGLALEMDVYETSGAFGRRDRWARAIGLPKRSILVAGASGAGKTEVAKQIVQQLLFDQDSLVLVYDHKTDFQDFFETQRIEYIHISMTDSSHIWNLFQEFDDPHDVDEFARALFPELSGGDNDFFDDTARQVFAACLKMMLHRSGPENLSNAMVRHYFQTRGVRDVYQDLDQYPTFQAAASAINVEASPKQAQGVYASVQRVVNNVFVGDFGAEPKNGHGFSIREHVQDPQGVPIVLDFPKAAGQSTKPIFRFLIDHAAMFAMEESETYSYFVLDEFAQIPHLRRLEELVNVGRGERVVTLVTLQSVEQLYSNYDRERGGAILAGLVSMILLRANDPETVEFYRSAIGTDFTTYTQHIENKDQRDEKRETKAVEEHPFSIGEMQRWDPGVGVVVTQTGWLHGYISMLNETTRAVITSVLSPSAEHDRTDDATKLSGRTETKAIESNTADETSDETADGSSINTESRR